MSVNCPGCSGLFRRVPLVLRFTTSLADGFNENSTNTYYCERCKNWFERYDCYGYDGRLEWRDEDDLMKANNMRRNAKYLYFTEYKEATK